jgi:thiamine monophosphate kinase
VSCVPFDPIRRMVRDVAGHLHVVVAASEHGYVESALEACLSAKETLQSIREELLRPEPGTADPRHDYNS